MDIGIGLPSTIPGVDRGQHLEWARRAEERGFSTLGTIDRLVTRTSSRWSRWRRPPR